jgi:hypothetical protein
MTFPFIPYSKRWPAWLFLAGGGVLGFLWGFERFKPDYLNVPVFAVYSSYLKKVVFGMSQTNVTDELALILILAGLLWLVCSREKKDGPETDILRYKALVYSVLFNSGFLLFSALFIFGIGFITVMIVNLFSQLVFYLVIFRILRWGDS